MSFDLDAYSMMKLARSLGMLEQSGPMGAGGGVSPFGQAQWPGGAPTPGGGGGPLPTAAPPTPMQGVQSGSSSRQALQASRNWAGNVQQLPRGAGAQPSGMAMGPARMRAPKGTTRPKRTSGNLDDLIGQHTQDPKMRSFLKAIAQQESSGGKNNLNPDSKARGPWQIMEKTARGLGYTGPASALADAEVSLPFIIRNTEANLQRSGGSWDDAIAMHYSGRPLAENRKGGVGKVTGTKYEDTKTYTASVKTHMSQQGDMGKLSDLVTADNFVKTLPKESRGEGWVHNVPDLNEKTRLADGTWLIPIPHEETEKGAIDRALHPKYAEDRDPYIAERSAPERPTRMFDTPAPQFEFDSGAAERAAAGAGQAAASRVSSIYQQAADAIEGRELSEEDLSPERQDPNRHKLGSAAALGLDAIGSALRGQPGGQVYKHLQYGQEAAFASQDARAQQRRDFNAGVQRDLTAVMLASTNAMANTMGETERQSFLSSYKTAETKTGFAMEEYKSKLMAEGNLEVARMMHGGGKGAKDGSPESYIGAAANFAQYAATQRAQQELDGIDPEEMVFTIPVMVGDAWIPQKIVGVTDLMNRMHANAMYVPEIMHVPGGGTVRAREAVVKMMQEMIIDRFAREAEAKAKKKSDGGMFDIGEMLPAMPNVGKAKQLPTMLPR